MSDDHWTRGAYAAEFRDEDQFVAALTALSAQGYGEIETYTPYPVGGADAVLGDTSSPLPVLVFLGVVAGAVCGYAIQWYANVVSYPIDIGGRPTHAVPAFIIPAFETAVLVAALVAFFGLFTILKLPRLWHPLFEIDDFETASVDSFWIAIDGSDGRVHSDLTPKALADLGSVRVVHIEAEP